MQKRERESGMQMEDVEDLFEHPPLDFAFDSQDELFDGFVSYVMQHNRGEVPIVFVCDKGDGVYRNYAQVRRESMASPLFMVLARHLLHNRQRQIDTTWSARFLAMAQNSEFYLSHAQSTLECSLESRIWHDMQQAIETFKTHSQHATSIIMYQTPLGRVVFHHLNHSDETNAFYTFLETTFKHLDCGAQRLDIDALENEIEATAPQEEMDALDAFNDSDDEGEDTLHNTPCWAAMREIKAKLIALYSLTQ